MAQAVALISTIGAGDAAGRIASSIMNTLAEIAKIIARLVLELMRWFRETVLSNPWRALAFFGSAAILAI